MEHILVRALAGGERVLRTRLGSALGELPLARVDKITFPAPGTSEDDYATVIVEWGGNPQEQLVRVKEGEKDVLLTGYSPTGMDLEIPLSECRSVAFEAITEGEAEWEEREPLDEAQQ